MLTGYDIDGVISAGIEPTGDYVIISGRTFSEYDDLCRSLASKAPLYIRGAGKRGDRVHAGRFKAAIIEILSVATFHEDDPIQAEIIRSVCPFCEVVIHPGPKR